MPQKRLNFPFQEAHFTYSQIVTKTWIIHDLITEMTTDKAKCFSTCWGPFIQSFNEITALEMFRWCSQRPLEKLPRGSCGCVGFRTLSKLLLELQLIKEYLFKDPDIWMWKRWPLTLMVLFSTRPHRMTQTHVWDLKIQIYFLSKYFMNTKGESNMKYSGETVTTLALVYKASMELSNR